jgi:hypothetical protein
MTELLEPGREALASFIVIDIAAEIADAQEVCR